MILTGLLVGTIVVSRVVVQLFETDKATPYQYEKGWYDDYLKTEDSLKKLANDTMKTNQNR